MKNLTESDVIALIVPLAKSIALKYESIGIVGIEQGPEAHQITVTLADGETYTLTFSLAAAGVSFTPASGMSSTNVQDAINELLDELLLVIDDIVLKADKVEDAIEGDFAGLDASGNLTDSGIAIKDFPKTFTRLEKKADYLYDIYYDSIDYATAEEYFKTKGPTSALGSCSMVRNGNFIGRNFDWLYSEDVEFVVQIPANAGRYATTGVVGTVRDGAKALTKSFVESGAYSSLYSVLPFMIVDGWNSKGVYCGTNVVPKQKNNGNLISPSGTVEKKICMIMLPRFVIDNFATATEAVTYLQEHVALFPSKTLSETYQYEQHFIIADKTKTYLVEFVDSEIVVTEKNYMTNFYLDGVTFNNDGKVYTPADVPSGHSPTEDNGITSLGSGLERYNLIVDNYSTANTAQGMRSLMNQLLYTRAYSTSPNVADPEWYTEFVGINNLTVDSTPTEFAQTYTNAGTMFANKSRNPQSQNFGVWQTVHSCVYDYANMKLSIVSQENTNKTFEYTLSDSTSSEPIVTQNVEIESADWVSGNAGNYSYSADIEVEGATDKDVSIVTFSESDADSGDFASVCDTTEDTVTIYSKTARDVTIPLVLTIRTNTEPEVTGPAILYETGTQTVSMTWAELESGDYLSFNNGTLSGGSNKTQLEGDLVIGNVVTNIETYAFDGCTSLTGVTISSSVTSIGDSSFYGCTSLTTITIPSSVTSIGAYAFSGCSGLTSITFEENSQLASIDNYAFRNCTSLTTITIPSGVSSIGYNVFQNCNNLTSLIVSANYNNTTNSNTLTSGQNYGKGQTPSLVDTEGYCDIAWDKVN